MKKLLLLTICAAIAMLAACDKDDNGRLDPSAMISLRAAKTANIQSRADGVHLTPKQIVEQALLIYLRNDNYPGTDVMSRMFEEKQRDVANERLLMYSTDIIDAAGAYHDMFIGAKDLVLVRYGEGHPNDFNHVDTIGYISNATMRAAEAQIKAAFDRKDYAACYQLFDTAFTYEPITGAEWRALQQ